MRSHRSASSIWLPESRSRMEPLVFESNFRVLPQRPAPNLLRHYPEMEFWFSQIKAGDHLGLDLIGYDRISTGFADFTKTAFSLNASPSCTPATRYQRPPRYAMCPPPLMATVTLEIVCGEETGESRTSANDLGRTVHWRRARDMISSLRLSRYSIIWTVRATADTHAFARPTCSAPNRSALDRLRRRMAVRTRDIAARARR